MQDAYNISSPFGGMLSHVSDHQVLKIPKAVAAPVYFHGFSSIPWNMYASQHGHMPATSLSGCSVNTGIHVKVGEWDILQDVQKFEFCDMHYSRHLSKGATKHMKCDWCNWKMKFLI